MMIYVLLLERVHGTVMYSTVYVYGSCMALHLKSGKACSGNAFGVKLLHLFTIPFGVYEKDMLMYCHAVTAWRERAHKDSSLT